MPRTQVALTEDSYLAAFEEHLKDVDSRDLLFLNELLRNELDIHKAAAKAGITAAEGGRIRRKAEVQKFLQWHLEEFRKDVQFHLPRLAKQVVLNAVFDPMPILEALAQKDWVGALRELEPEERATIQEVGIGKSGKPYVKFVNRTMASDQALRMMAGEHNLINNQPRQTVLGVQIILKGDPKVSIKGKVGEWQGSDDVIDLGGNTEVEVQSPSPQS
jgi:hypothetical protein